MPDYTAQPSAQDILAHRARLLANLAHYLLSAESLEVRGGLRVIRDELRSLLPRLLIFALRLFTIFLGLRCAFWLCFQSR